jgi:hypothetical protein
VTHDDSAPCDESNGQARPPIPEKESGATLDAVPSSQPDPALDLEPTSDSDPRPEPEPTVDVTPTSDSEPLPPSELEPTSDTDQTPPPLDQTSNGSPVAAKSWFVDMADIFQRYVLPLLIPPVLLLVITAIVVTLGSALLLLSASELTIGQIVIAWPVVAAALGVLVVGFGALWLASRETVRPSDH